MASPVKQTELAIVMKTNSAKRAEVGNNLSVTKKYDTIKLGIDCHARQYRVVRIIDGASPEPAQCMSPAKFLDWAAKQTQLARVVYSVYEAGPGGFVLHRQLLKLGIVNFVIAPRRPSVKGRKNDKLDALHLALDLERYLGGNRKAISLVHVPTPEQEQRRHETRQREQLRRHRLSLSAQGRTLLLSQGWVRSNSWWMPDQWMLLRDEVPTWMLTSLELYRDSILDLEKQIAKLTQKITAAAPAVRPKGVGPLSYEQIEREVVDWDRFPNRKSPGAYCGLVGGFDSSGERCTDLPISKMGNGRLRATLVEVAWRLVIYQPDCPLIQRWAGVLLNPAAHKRARKRAIIAVARQFFVDLWKWRTGRKSAAELGWIMMGEEEKPSEPAVAAAA